MDYHENINLTVHVRFLIYINGVFHAKSSTFDPNPFRSGQNLSKVVDLAWKTPFVKSDMFAHNFRTTDSNWIINFILCSLLSG